MPRSRAPRTQSSTKGRVLDLIRSLGPVSRVELTDLTGMTAATITNTVRQLMADGVVVEAGRMMSTGGKPRVLLDIEPRACYALGMQIERDSLTYVAIDLAGAIVGRFATRPPADEPPHVAIAWMADVTRRFVTDIGISPADITGIGLAAPGPLDVERGELLGPPTMRRWSGFPIAKHLEKETKLPVLLDTHAIASAVGEFWTGSISENSTACTIYMGSDLAAGVMHRGSVYLGAKSNAGAIGQIEVATPRSGGPARPLEDVVGPAAVVKSALAQPDLATAGFELDGGDDVADFAAIVHAALEGDPVALRVVNWSAQDLADAALVMANLFDVDCMLLAGPSFAGAGSLYVAILQERLNESFFARAQHGVEVRLSPHPSDTAAVGAAALVLQDRFAPRAVFG